MSSETNADEKKEKDEQDVEIVHDTNKAADFGTAWRIAQTHKNARDMRCGPVQ